MKTLMISTDREIFTKGSAVYERMKEYGKLAEELHIVVLTKHGYKRTQLSENVVARPTNSWFKVLHLLFTYRGALRELEENTDSSDDWLITTQDPFETGYAGLKVTRKIKKKMKEKSVGSLKFQVQAHTDFLSPHFKNSSFLNKIRLHLAKKVLPEADCIRVVSERIKDSLIKTDKYKLKVIPEVLPIVVDKQKIFDTPPKKDISEEYPGFNFLLLMVSRLEPEKDIETGLEALKEVTKTYSKIGLVVVGSGGQKRYLQKKARQLAIEENVVFEGRQEDTISYYKTCHAFLSTSLYEGYGRTLAEAALAELPIITTDVGVAGYELKDEECIYMCATEDKDCLAGKIRQCINESRDRVYKAKMASHKMNEVIPDKPDYLKQMRDSWHNCGK